MRCQGTRPGEPATDDCLRRKRSRDPGRAGDSDGRIRRLCSQLLSSSRGAHGVDQAQVGIGFSRSVSATRSSPAPWTRWWTFSPSLAEATIALLAVIASSLIQTSRRQGKSCRRNWWRSILRSELCSVVGKERVCGRFLYLASKCKHGGELVLEAEQGAKVCLMRMALSRPCVWSAGVTRGNWLRG